tara:strand:- start:6817 stop:7578 length:762 start_codon:yes stop_codon:yes gene_type:complete
MEQIPDIDIQVTQISTSQIQIWSLPVRPTAPETPPVTVLIGTPVVDIPGCVEFHPDDKRAQNLPIEDTNGLRTLCPNGQYPSFNAMDYSPEDLIYTTAAKPPAYAAPPDPETPETKVPEVPKEEVPCPGPNAPRIGDVAQNQKEKVVGFELNEDKTICITLYEDIGVVEQYLPSAQLATTTAVIASTAVISSVLAKPLADLLLKAVKPIVKKVITAVQKKLGKTPRKLTISEIRSNQYREKRSLPPLKEPKKK